MIHNAILRLAVILVFLGTPLLLAQEPLAPNEPATLRPDPKLGPIAEADRTVPLFTRFKSGDGELPNGAGQVWREYDIRPYTSKLKNVEKPQNTIVDWILRETGTNVWFHEPSGLMSANEQTIRVYHTEEIQGQVARIVDRFASGRNEDLSVQVRLITVHRADWRQTAWPMLTPVIVQSSGIEAWLLQKEDAALLLAQLRGRPDFREHNSHNLMVHCGHSHVIERFWPRYFVQGVQQVSGFGFQPRRATLNEGFSLRINPLLSVDAKTVHAAIKCNVEQLEEMTRVAIDVPSENGTQRVQTEVPQISSWRIHERFQWPADQVLMISRGLVAMPGLRATGAIPGLQKLVGNKQPRFEVILLLQANTDSDYTARRKDFRSGQLNYRGRY